jgi:hypothetical protein
MDNTLRIVTTEDRIGVDEFILPIDRWRHPMRITRGLHSFIQDGVEVDPPYCYHTSLISALSSSPAAALRHQQTLCAFAQKNTSNYREIIYLCFLCEFQSPVHVRFYHSQSAWSKILPNVSLSSLPGIICDSFGIIVVSTLKVSYPYVFS